MYTREMATMLEYWIDKTLGDIAEDGSHTANACIKRAFAKAKADVDFVKGNWDGDTYQLHQTLMIYRCWALQYYCIDNAKKINHSKTKGESFAKSWHQKKEKEKIREKNNQFNLFK